MNGERIPSQINNEDLEDLKSEIDSADDIAAEEGLLKRSQESPEEVESVDHEPKPDQEPSAETASKDQAESVESAEDFNSESVKEMIEMGWSDKDIWEEAKKRGVFPKYNGSSYYLSEHLSDPDSNAYWWRRRSAAGNTSGDGYRQADMFDNYIQNALDKYREEMKLEEEQVNSNDQKSKVEATEQPTSAEDDPEVADNSEETLKEEEVQEELDEILEEEDIDTSDAEAGPDTEAETQESSEKISVGDEVYYMEKEMRRWRDPKEIIAIEEVKGKEYAEFADDDSLYPLKKLALAESSAEGKDYQPGPESAESMPEELEDVPGAKELAAEIEEMPESVREKVGWWFKNIGHKTEEVKAKAFQLAYGSVSERLNQRDDQGTLARWFTSLKEQFDEKVERAEAAMDQNEHTDPDDGLWDKTKSQFKDKWKLVGNALKTGGVFISPRRALITVSSMVSSGAEAGKEARFKNTELMEQTRIKDARQAANEAWDIKEQAQKQSGGDGEVTKDLLQRAYIQSLPEDILDRLHKDQKGKGRVADVSQAYEEAMRIKEAAEADEESDQLTTEALEEAFEKLFDDPQPGEATAFVGGIYERVLRKFAQKINNDFFEIDMDDSLTEAEKAEKKDAYLSKWGRSGMLEDFDRMLTETGKLDSWALSAWGGEKAGKAVVAGAITDFFLELTTGDGLPEWFQNIHNYMDGIPDDISEAAEISESQDGVSTAGFGFNFVPESLTSAFADGEVSDSIDIESAQPDSATVDSAGDNPLETGGGSASAESAGVESVEPDSADTNPFETGGESVDGDPIGTEAITIDEDGEGMIHAIADKLEDEHNLSHDKAMEIGNQLYVKGEQLEGDDEMFNLVGKGASFQLDFGDLQAADLESQSAEDLAEAIDFDNSEVDPGDSGVEPELEVPKPPQDAPEYSGEGSEAASTSGKYEDNPVEHIDQVDVPSAAEAQNMSEEELESWKQELKEEGIIIDEENTSGAEATGETGAETETTPEAEDTGSEESSAGTESGEAEVPENMTEDQLREVVVQEETAAHINDQIETLLQKAEEMNSSSFGNISVDSLNSLQDYLQDHSDQNLITTIEDMSDDNPKLLLTLDQVVEVEDNPPGGLMDQLDQFISEVIADKSDEIGRGLEEEAAVAEAHADAVSSADADTNTKEKVLDESERVEDKVREFKRHTGYGDKVLDRLSALNDLLR